MRRRPTQRNCKHCQTFFAPDPRSAGRQRYCSAPACRHASKAASQRRWLHKPANREYFRGAIHRERVRQWRQAHPGYWRRQGTRTAEALQEDCTPQPSPPQALESTFTSSALQDDFLLQPAVFVGLIAHLTGLTLQEDIATTTRRLQQLGRDILARSPPDVGGSYAQTSPFSDQAPPRPPAI